jgi:cytochrome c biogenesis protein
MPAKQGLLRCTTQTLSAVRTGIILLILVVLVSAAGTLILQRPNTGPDDMQRAYSPQTLALLDALHLTDVYHSWYFLALIGLLAVCIIFASLERWPNAWRYYSRPYRRTDKHFRAALPLQNSFPIQDSTQALEAAQRVLRRHGLRAERIEPENPEAQASLYAEKNRFAVMAVYVVHASLLLVLLGGVVDALGGYKGYVTLVPGQAAIQKIELRDGSIKKLPFQLRCDAAGQENYTGEFAMMPKRWWSKLTVLEDGREVMRQEVAVNEPLTYRGVRFYQSEFGVSPLLRTARIALFTPATISHPNVVDLNLGATATLDGASLKLVSFLPDAYQMDGNTYQRSRDLGDSAAVLELTPKGGKAQELWLFRTDRAGPKEVVLVGPYDAAGNVVPTAPFHMVAYLNMAPFTGLSVSHQPGQWAVWTGCLLMGVGLLMAFWVVHQRYWIVPVTNEEGALVLWFGAAANKNREAFELRFRELADEISKEIGGESAASAATSASAARD